MERMYARYTKTDDAGVRVMDEMMVRYNMPLISTATSYAKKVLLFCYNKGGFLLLYLDVLLK